MRENRKNEKQVSSFLESPIPKNFPDGKNSFAFLDPGRLIDNDVELVLVERKPAVQEKCYFPSYIFKIRNVQSGEKVGLINLRIGNNDNTKYGGHIGYNVVEEYRGHQSAARSCKLLFPLAKRHGINPLWITCNPENIASRKTCERAGGKLIKIVDLPEENEQYQRGDRQKCCYRFDL